MIPVIPIIILLYFLGIILSLFNKSNRSLYIKIRLRAIYAVIIFYFVVVIFTDSGLYASMRLNTERNSVGLTYKWKFKTKTLFSWFTALISMPFGREAPNKILISEKDKMILFQAGNYAYAIDKDNGKKIWIRKIGKQNGVGIEPALFKDKVIFATAEPMDKNDYELKDVFIQCLSIRTGEVIWKKLIKVCFEGYEGNFMYLTAMDDKVIVSFYNSEGNNVYLLNGYTGEIVWAKRMEGRIVAMPVFDVKRIFVSIGESTLQTFKPKIVAIEMMKGDIFWEKKTNNDPTGVSISDGYGVYVTENKHKKAENYLECIDLNTGAVIWSKRLFISILNYLPPPFIKDGIIYIYANEGNIMAIELLTGKQIWASLPFGPSGGDSWHKFYWGRKSNVIIYNNVVLSGIEFNMGIINKNKGDILGIMDLNVLRSVGLYLDSYYIEDLALLNNMVYFSASDGSIYALKAHIK